MICVKFVLTTIIAGTAKVKAIMQKKVLRLEYTRPENKKGGFVTIVLKPLDIA